MASTSTQFGAREQHLASQAGPGPLALLPFPWPRHITSPGAAPRPVIHPLWGGYTQVCGCDMDRHSALITPATERGGAWDSVWPLGEQLQERMPGREGSRKRKMQGPRPGLTARYPKQGLGPASLGEGLPYRRASSWLLPASLPFSSADWGSATRSRPGDSGFPVDSKSMGGIWETEKKHSGYFHPHMQMKPK